MRCWSAVRAPSIWGPTIFVGLIQAAARHTSRFVQILATAGQSPDHPVHPAIPETRYLKAFFCRVTRA
jgi:23S rRNA (cytosine1962-C5)-methyltransferase